MFVKVKFEYLSGLKGDEIYLTPETFEENGCIYVSKVDTLESSMFHFESRDFNLPPYLALKSFPGFVQACFPNARVIVVEASGGN